jgi:hypothetical protein
MVLADPDDETNTLSVTLPGRGPVARVKGFFSKGKYQAAQQRLDELRAEHAPVVVTLRCRGNATPAARSIAYQTAEGSRESILF